MLDKTYKYGESKIIITAGVVRYSDNPDLVSTGQKFTPEIRKKVVACGWKLERVNDYRLPKFSK